MPRYILPKSKQLSDYLGNAQIVKSLLHVKESGQFESRMSDRNFLENELTDILIMDDAAGASDNLLKYVEFLEIVGEFHHDFKRYMVDENILKTFLDDSVILANNFIAGNSGYELAFRMYIGHDNNIDISKRIYNVVIVPMCSKRNAGGDIDHNLDREDAVFSVPPSSFFALVFSNGADGRRSTVLQDCKDLLLHKDDVSTPSTLLIYHTFTDLDGFRRGLDNRFAVDKMQIDFGRIIVPGVGAKLTVILSFINLITGPVLSTVVSGATKTSGIVFDKGDLIPPPPIVNSLIIP